MPQHEPEDIDARFREIMAGWDLDADPRGRPGTTVPDGAASDPAPGEGPAVTDLPFVIPDDPGAPSQDQRRADRWLVYRDPTSGLSMGTDHRSWSPGDDPDDEFVPPQPAPVPAFAHDPWWWAILAGLVGGPLVLLVLTLTGRTSPRLYLWLAGLATAAALVGLFWRLPSRTDRDDYDDGARV